MEEVRTSTAGNLLGEKGNTEEEIRALNNLVENVKTKSAQEVIDTCLYDKDYNSLCEKYEQVIWSMLLERDYPQWGILDNAKEYYNRIAGLKGLKLRDTSAVSGVPGKQLLYQQEQQILKGTMPNRAPLMMRFGNLDPFPVADILAKTYTTALSKLISFNETYAISDPAKWIWTIPEDEFQTALEETGKEGQLSREQFQEFIQRVNDYFRRVLSENETATTYIVENETDEYMIIKISAMLECKADFCDDLIFLVEKRITRLATSAREGDIHLEPVDILLTEFNVAPGYVHIYLRSVSDLLFMNDSFSPEIIEYYQAVIAKIPTIRVSLMPHGYPFLKRENIDRHGPDAAALFIVNPLEKPSIVPDYMSAKIFAKLDMSNPEIRIWRIGMPPPLIDSVPTVEVIQSRMEVAQPGILKFLAAVTKQMKKIFPRGEAGFVLAGGMLCMALDDWMSSDKGKFLLKTDGDFFVYGQTDELRRRAFKIIFAHAQTSYPWRGTGFDANPKGFEYTYWKSVATIDRQVRLTKDFEESAIPVPAWQAGPRTDRFRRRIGMQIINTNSKDAFEVIMNFDCSHIQLGWDCHREWIATPFWQLYYPRRESLLVRYNIRSPRFIKALYRGFTLKKLMPYALILTPKGIGYTYVLRDNNVIELLPSIKATYADDLQLASDSIVRLDHINPVQRQDQGHRGPDHARSTPQDIARFPRIRQIKKDSNGVVSVEEKNISSGIKKFDENVEYPSIKGTFIWQKSPDDVLAKIQFNGQFKNGFDAYVRESYLTYDLGKAQFNEAGEQIDVEATAMRYIIRDCKLLIDPTQVPVEYQGTVGFNFSLRTAFLKQRRDTFHTSYTAERGDSYRGKREAERLTVTDSRGDHIVTQVQATPDALSFPETEDVGSYSKLNPQIVRNRYNIPMVVEGIVRLRKRKPRKINVQNNNNESGSEEESDEESIEERGEEERGDEKNGDATTDFNEDNIDLHGRFYSDEEREAMPVYDFQQWQDIRMHKIDIGAATAVRIRVPVIISEALFLDAADWVMSIEDVVRNREQLMFNCMCYQDYTREGKEGLFGGDIKIYRSFLVVE